MRSSLPCDAPPCQAVPDDKLRLIVDSYRRLTGKELFDPAAATLVGAASAAMGSSHYGEIAAEAAPTILRLALWNAPRAIVAHGTEADPVFFYGNRLALELFEMSFEDFTRLPSRYSGVRIAASGRRFMIEAATVWNLMDEAGNHRGQAATFTDWGRYKRS